MESIATQLILLKPMTIVFLILKKKVCKKMDLETCLIKNSNLHLRKHKSGRKIIHMLTKFQTVRFQNHMILEI